MARQEKKIILPGDTEPIVVYELTTRQIMEKGQELLAITKSGKEDIGILNNLLTAVLPGCTSLGEKTLDLAPSELKHVRAAFLEVNNDFFETLEWLGVKHRLLTSIKEQQDSKKTPAIPTNTASPA